MKKGYRVLRGRLSPILLALALTPFAIGQGKAAPSRYSMSFFDTFDTVITIQGFAEDRASFDRVTLAAREMFITYHRMFDSFHAYEGINNVFTLNRYAAEGPVCVPPELFELIALCRDVQPGLRHTVNIAMGAVIELWHEAREDAERNPAAASLPDREDLLAASHHSDLDSVRLDADAFCVYFEDPLLKLDLGAVAKGYATEKVAQFMLASEMPSFIINAGGNIRTGNPPLDGRQAWAVAIQDPDGHTFSEDGSDILDTLYLSGLSVVTSGDYQRFFIVDGERYHHIISPSTLMPARYMRSVTIVTEDSGTADLLSTALFLLPYKEGLDLLRTLEGVEALWVLNDRSVVMTDGLKRIAKSAGATQP